MNRRWPAAAIALLVAACTSPDTRAQQLERGATVYRRECQCHDVEGAIGVTLSSRVLASYGTARRLFNYVQLAMPYQAPRTLPEQEYWDVVAFLVARDSLAAVTSVLTPQAAEAVAF